MFLEFPIPIQLNEKNNVYHAEFLNILACGPLDSRSFGIFLHCLSGGICFKPGRVDIEANIYRSLRTQISVAGVHLDLSFVINKLVVLKTVLSSRASHVEEQNTILLT